MDGNCIASDPDGFRSCLGWFAIPGYRNPCIISFAWNAACLIVPLVGLRSECDSWRLYKRFEPLLDCGTMWSTVRFLNGK